MRFTGVAEHAPGASMVIADLLSRKPLDNKTSDTEEDVRYSALSVIASLTATRPKIMQIREATAQDLVFSKTMEYNTSGWLAANEVLLNLREMYRFHHNFTVIEDMLFYMNRLVIPEKLRNEMLERLHSGHMGIMKTQLRAKQAMWWPGINQQMEKTVGTCEHCEIHGDVHHAEPLMTCSLPEQPWQRINADLLTHKTQCYMTVSRWILKMA